jgi:hypothetical protein
VLGPDSVWQEYLTASRRRCLMPRNMEDAVTSRVPTIGFITFGETDDQLLRLDFDPDHMGVTRPRSSIGSDGWRCPRTERMTRASISAAGTRRMDAARSAWRVYGSHYFGCPPFLRALAVSSPSFSPCLRLSTLPHVSCRAKDQFLSGRKKSGTSPDSSLSGKSVAGSGTL